MANSNRLAEFDKQPTLDGPSLRLRPLARADYDALFAVASDPELWALHPASDRYQEPVFRNLFEDAMASGGALVVIDKASSKVIGSSRYHVPDTESNRAEIGWSFLARVHWGGRTNAEVKHLMLTHAFRFVETVQFRVGETNARSRRAMEKIGGVLSDERETIQMPDRTEVVHLIYEISKPASP